MAATCFEIAQQALRPAIRKAARAQLSTTQPKNPCKHYQNKRCSTRQRAVQRLQRKLRSESGNGNEATTTLFTLPVALKMAMASSSSVHSFTSLPTEIIEEIFYHIPIPDLLRNTSLVCKQWHSIIAASSFSTYRKDYYKYKIASPIEKRSMLGDSTVATSQEGANRGPLLTALHIPNMHDSPYLQDGERIHNSVRFLKRAEPSLSTNRDMEMVIPWIIRFVCDKFDGDFSQVKKHTKYEFAATWMEEMLPEVAQQNISAGIVALLCAVAENVWDVREVILALTLTPKCRVKDVSELFYCIATAFLHFHIQLKYPVPMRQHFLLYQALYYYENDWKYDASLKSSLPTPSRKRKVGQATLLNFAGFTTNKKSACLTPTSEQMAVVKQPLIPGSGSVTKIVAFAGTGKTTTLIRLCEENPHLKFLVVVYNKSAKEHAKECFPQSGNVKCITAHGMAMSKGGFRYSKKLTTDLKTTDIIDADVIPKEDNSDKNRTRKRGDDQEPRSYHRLAAMVRKTLHNFMCSKEVEITLDDHVPTSWPEVGGTPVSPEVRGDVLQGALTSWEAMADPTSDRLRITHDGYLKVWQINNPNLQWVWEHDVLLIDEAQDMNPAMLDIFLKQTKTPKIFVGDPHQQIYLFRGAVNALDLVEANKVFYLTQSFRFGPEIAYVANCCLEVLKGEDKKTIVGGKKIDKLIYRDLEAGVKDGQVAILARKNSTLFSEAVERLIQKSSSKTGAIQHTGFFIGGTDHFDDLLQIFYLMSKEKAKMTKYKKFATFAALKAFAKNTDDATLMGKINTVESYSKTLPEYVERLRRLCSGKNIRNADYVFSTIHKAKGLEWDSVVIVDDFDWSGTYYDFCYEFKPWYEVIKCGDEFDLPEDQKNMLYVAVTRARNNLQMTYHLMQILIRNGDDQWRVGVRRPSMCREECDGCVHCGECKECGDTFKEDRPFFLSKF